MPRLGFLRGPHRLLLWRWGQLIVNRPENWGGRILLAGVAAGVFVCIDLENAGPRNADAFESQVDIKIKPTGSSRETTSFKGQVGVPDWLSIKFDSSVLDLNPARLDPFTSYGFKPLDPMPKEMGAVTDTRITLGVWDDWVRLTSRQAVSSYIKPIGTGLGYLGQTGLGFENGATSQRIETRIWKTDSMKLSLFADYASVGAYFVAPDNAIKRQDPFSKPNSTTTRFGGTVERGPITFTLEQSSQQSLAQYDAPILVKNQIGASLSFDQLLGQSGGLLGGMSWMVPSSAYLNVGQGRMRASLIQGVNGDTTSDVSAGLSWTRGKIYANLGYWQSNYQSQLYPWKGSGINGSLGFQEGPWGIDLYFDGTTSATSYALTGMQQLIPQTFDAKYMASGLRFHSTFTLD
jgi:hypothetical protein